MGISGAVLVELMIDVGWLSLLLLVGKLLRAKILLFQKLFLPASIIAGFIGLFLGPYLLGSVLDFEIIPQSMLTTWASLPGILINIVFACLFLGFSIPSLSTIWRERGPQLCYGWTVGMGQYMAGVDISVVLLSPLSGVPAFFGCLLKIGSSGGPGAVAGWVPHVHLPHLQLSPSGTGTDGLQFPPAATAQCMTRARGPLCQGVGSALVSATHMQCPSAPRAAAVWEDPQ